jgi:hypothetical protein
MSAVNVKRFCCLIASHALLCGSIRAQELTPRAYWPAPVGTDVLVLAWQQNTGDVVVDPSLPISGVDSHIEYAQIGYQRSVDMFGRSASIQFSQPYADGVTRGEILGQYRERSTAGLGDSRIRLAVNLKGAPAMDAEGFANLRQNPRMIVGTSLIVQAPTGAYDSDRVINLGSNRWSIKPAVGVLVPLRPTWLFEAELGVWIFGDNNNFLGETRAQDDIVSTEVHLIKRIRPGFWASVDANFYTGGETRIGDEIKEDLQRNSRAGFTVVFPIHGRHAVRGSYSTGVSTRSGGDFEILTFSYLYAW